MKVFKLEVGTYTRKGNFVKHFEKVIQVNEDIELDNIKRHFIKKYEGFSITVASAVIYNEEIAPLKPAESSLNQRVFITSDVSIKDARFNELKIAFIEKNNALNKVKEELTKAALNHINYNNKHLHYISDCKLVECDAHEIIFKVTGLLNSAYVLDGKPNII